uniref:tyrosine-type recombinase/integrase n=1 Tax=Marinobacterium profundum TaxID=1714300 RepID=UPI0008346636|nr:integrase arm-type DNA-binding domain-containing protein [Marinobacterium profundum]
MALSDLIIRQAKATGKTYNLVDTDGLGLVVSPVGGKSWYFRYYWLGKQKRMSLGAYPEIGLRQARALRDESRALLASGINPHTERKQKRRAVRLAAENTFEAIFWIWVEHRRKVLKIGRQSTLSQIQRIFCKDVLPSVGKIPIYDIRRPQLLELLSRIEQRKAFTTAEKVRAWFRQLFRYALVIVDGLETNPAFDLDVVAVPKPPVEHNPFLRMDELPVMLQKLRIYPGKGPQTQLGIRLLLLTGVRTGELRSATPEQFDLERGLWIIPAQNVKQLQNKMRRSGRRPQDVPPYIVPLSVQAIEVIGCLLSRVKPAQHYLFAHRSDFRKRISENTLNRALRQMGYEDRLTGHGIRGTISTALNEVGYPKIWVDAQLSHADTNKVSAAYNHAMHVEPRRRMMQDWADRLDMLEQGQVQAASAHLAIHIEGMPSVKSIANLPDTASRMSVAADENPALGASTVVNSSEGGQSNQRLSPLPIVPESVVAQEVSGIQQEHQEMLAIYEAPQNIPMPLFAQLAGKSRDQVNRELKTGKLLALNMGKRGQRVPGWQLDPIKNRLVRAVLKQALEGDSWQIYHALTQPYRQLDGKAPIDYVTLENFHTVAEIVVSRAC